MLEENKDILSTEDTFAENAVQDTDTNVEQELEQNTEPSVVQDFEQNTDLSTEIDEVNTTSEKNKKAILQFPIIVAIIIVAVTAIVLLVFKCFFNQSVVGSWELDTSSTATADEATTSSNAESKIKEYFIFENDGKMIIKEDSMDLLGTYETTVAEGGTKQIICNTPSGQVIFNYEVSGNVFTGRNLTLINSYNAEDENNNGFTFKASKVDIPQLEPDKDFKPNDKIVGSWKFDNGVTFQTLTFNDDGTAQYNQNDMLIVNGIYTYDDKTITLTYYYSKEEVPMEMSYKIDDKGLMINDYLHTKVDPSAVQETNAVTTQATQ